MLIGEDEVSGGKLPLGGVPSSARGTPVNPWGTNLPHLLQS